MRNFPNQNQERFLEISASVFQSESFHNAIGPVIYCAQFFGVMPLSGSKSTDPNSVKFRWYSLRNAGSIGFLFWDLVIMILYIKYFTNVGLSLGNMVSMVFFSMSFLGYYSFFLLAAKWPRFIVKWTKMEMRFLQSPYFFEKQTLRNKIKSTALWILALAVGEHIMFQASAMHGFFTKLNECNIQTDDRVKYYYMNSYPYIFDFLPYNIIIAILMQLLSLTSTVVWNFMDLFIILVSIGLNARFLQIYSLILQRQNDMTTDEQQIYSEHFFQDIRRDFIQVCDLLSYVDKEMAFIILVSCINNLYFICYQLMNIFQTLRHPINYIYFWYSVAYLLGRTIFLFLSAAKINDSVKRISPLLRNVKRDDWSEEIERLLLHLNTETIALSGMGFFYFSRKLILAMAGTVTTFELVILQFSWESTSKVLPSICD